MPNVWPDRDFQYNTITYGFDVRSGMPIDRRFVLTPEQMDILSRHPYNIMMPQNYFCVMKNGKDTKVYVYNADNPLVYPTEDFKGDFPLAYGRFRLYDSGHPIVIPEDKYGNPEKLLEPNDDGNVELPFADSENYGLVKIDPNTLDIDPDTGKLKAHGMYRTKVLRDSNGQFISNPPYKNENTIYFLTEDDKNGEPKIISGLYA